MTVTKQQKLEFAAVHIDEWKSGYDFAVIEKTNDGQLCVRWPSICSGGVSKEEWQQERDKMQKQQDSSWHERGEFPPVGVVCMAHITSENKLVETEIVAHRDGYALGWCHAEKCGYHGDDVTDFRPLRTEREKAIDEMYKVMRERGSGINNITLGELYDAGFRMIKEAK